MDSNQLIKDICCCLKLLCNCEKSVLTLSIEDKLAKLETSLLANIENLKCKISNNVYIHSQISLYLNSEHSKQESVEWAFVEYCLVLLILLKNALDDVIQSPVEGGSTDTSSVLSAPPLSGNVLSIEQGKVVVQSLEFIIGLGIIPNLIPAVRFLLRWKSDFSDLVEGIQKDVAPWKKHCCLIACVTCLLECSKESSLGSLILSHHLEVLLTALIQLCYAPIKKLNNDQDSCHSGVSHEINTLDKLSIKNCCSNKSNCHLNLSEVLQKIHGYVDSEPSEECLITEMWKDRKCFTSEFSNLLQQIYKPLIIRELLLLTGAPSQGNKRKQRPPLWLSKACSEMLTDTLLQPDGVLAVVQGVLELCIGPNTSSGKNDISTSDWVKCDAVAKLIAHIPARLPSAELYYKHIWPQILKLIYKNDSIVGKSYLHVACCILSHMLEQHQSTTRIIVFGHLLRPLLNCLQHSNRSYGAEEPVIIATEDELQKCIDDLHKIILCGTDPTSLLYEELFPVYLPLFHLLSSLQEVSQLRNKVKDLLVTLYKKCDVEITVTLLNVASFDDSHFNGVYHLTNNIQFLPGSNGGMVIWHLPTKSDEWMMRLEHKCQAVKSLLEDLNNSAITGGFVISLMKRLTSLRTIENDCKENSTFLESNMEICLNLMQKHLLIIKFMECFSNEMENILIENKHQAINFVQEVLNHKIQMYERSHSESGILEEESLIIALNALEILAHQKDQLVSSDWDALKHCLPNLEKLITLHPEKHIKGLAECLKIAIVTHSVVGVKDARDFSNECKKIVSEPEKIEVHQNTRNSKHILKQNMMQGELQNLEKGIPQKADKGKHFDKERGIEISNDNPDLPMSNNTDNVTESNNSIKSTFKKDILTYQTVLQNLQDPLLPVRGHALMALNNLILKKDSETLSHKEAVLKILQENLLDSDTYIYLPAIQGLVDLANICTDYVLPILINSFTLQSEYSPDARIKFGEVLLKISKNLGNMIPKYKDLLINSFLQCAKDLCPQIRASSLSNLAEVCKQLKYGIGPFLQEILLCASSLVKSDQFIEVRRASVLLITLLLQGVGNDAFKMLESQMGNLYHLLKLVYSTEKDDVIKLHAQLALEEINTIVHNFMVPQQDFTKNINILDPLQ